jgi:hypothetical protein
MAMKRLLLMALVGMVLLNAGPIMADGDFYVIAVGRTEAVGTKITTLPYTISTPGLYSLGKNLAYASDTGDAITVNASDVTLDFMGFSLTGPGRQSSGGNCGILINNACVNVEIRNGSINDFGLFGIHNYSESCTGNRVIDIKVTDTGSAGITLLGTGHLVRGCSVMRALLGIGVGSSSLVKGNHTDQTDGGGISTGESCIVMSNVVTSNSSVLGAGYGSSVMDNTVASTSNTLIGIGVGRNCTVARNTSRIPSLRGIETSHYCTITNNTTQGLSYGDQCTVADNTITP